MARTKKNSPLDDALNMLGYSNTEESTSATNMDFMNETTSVDDLQNVNNNEPEEEDVLPAEDNNGSKDPHEDTSEIPEDVLNNINKSSSEDDNEEVSEEGHTEETNNDTVEPWESQQVGAFFDAFADALNWDVAEDEKPDSIQSLIDYIGDMVEQNSTPQYANEQVAQLDAYIKNGGNFEDFYTQQSRTISYDNIDMEDESNQKAVVRDYMRLQGFDDELISRKIERYEDADMLSEEAEDAVARLKIITEQQLAAKQAQQEQLRMQQEQQAIEFMNNLNSGIQNLDNIRGIAIPKEDRKALYDYITKTDADGLTQYQKDFNANMVDNLIESAYFTMKGDTLLGNAKKNGQTSAANKLRTMLRHQAKNHSSYNVGDERKPQAWEIASRYL